MDEYSSRRAEEEMIRVTSYGNEFQVEPIDGRTVLSLVNDKVKFPELDGIPFQCQAGTCKRCVVAVTEGQEFMEPPSEVERRALGQRLEKGFRLACQTRATNQKKYLRQKLIAQRKELKPDIRKDYDQAILQQCLAHPAIKEAKSILAYMDVRGEVATRELIESCWQQGKTVYLPVTDPNQNQIIPIGCTNFNQLQKGTFGILEPTIVGTTLEKSMPKLDVVIVPGVAFRTDGGRIGYGGGYYDRFLAKLPKHVVKMGLAYQLQINETFTVDEHDIMMDFVVTPKKVYRNKW